MSMFYVRVNFKKNVVKTFGLSDVNSCLIGLKYNFANRLLTKHNDITLSIISISGYSQYPSPQKGHG